MNKRHGGYFTGFALGAILAAEYIIGKTGVFSMNDLFNI